MRDIIVRYEKLNCSDVARELSNEIGKPELQNDIDSFLNQYWIYGDKKVRKTKFIGRLTAPFWYLFVGVVIISVLPIQWVFTGKFGFDRRSIMSKIINKWSKLF